MQKQGFCEVLESALTFLDIFSLQNLGYQTTPTGGAKCAELWKFPQTLPSYGSGRYGLGVFGAQDSVLRDRCSVGTRHAFLLITFLSKHLSTVLVRAELCHEVWNPGPQKKTKSFTMKTFGTVQFSKKSSRPPHLWDV